MNQQALIVTHSQVSATGPGTPLTMTSLLPPSRTLTADGAPQGEWNQGQTPLPLSLCPSPSLFISPCLSVSFSPPISIYLPLSFSLRVSLCIFLYISQSTSLPLYPRLSLSHTLPLPIYLPLSFSLRLSVSLTR